tara:strand:+ start:58 stop:564 length:507 start_codon:yes stop_codon:yes gene_type:complete
MSNIFALLEAAAELLVVIIVVTKQVVVEVEQEDLRDLVQPWITRVENQVVIVQYLDQTSQQLLQMVVVAVLVIILLLLLVDLAEVVKAHIVLLHYLRLKLVVVFLDQLNKVIPVGRDLQMVDHILVPLVEQVEEVVVLEVQDLPVHHLNLLKVLVELDFKLKLLEHHH